MPVSLEEIRARFSADRFATEALGAVIDEAEDGRAVCSVRLGPIHKNAVGGVMGGVSITLADFAFAVAANAWGKPTVSLDSHIQYIAAPRGDTLSAEARRVREGRSACFYEVLVRDGEGNLAARVSITGFHPAPRN